MTVRRRLLSCLVTALIVVVTATGRAQQPAARQNTGPQVLDVQGGQIRVVTVASGLVHPWSLAFLPDGPDCSSPNATAGCG